MHLHLAQGDLHDVKSKATYMMLKENSRFFSPANVTWQNLTSETLVGTAMSGSFPFSRSPNDKVLVQLTCVFAETQTERKTARTSVTCALLEVKKPRMNANHLLVGNFSNFIRNTAPHK